MDAVFLLSKDPTVDHGGDVALSKLIMRLAAESASVRAICLSGAPGPAADASVRRVPKPAVSPAAIAVRSLTGGRSLVHTRYRVPAMTAAIDESDAGVFIAEHSYMAEPYLDSRRAAERRLLVDTHVSESLVWRSTRGLIGRVDGARIVADELRTARAAHAVAAFDRAEAEDYRRRGVASARWLDITLPPRERIEVASNGPRLVFLGERSWPPNQEAARLSVEWWPRISRGIPGAELLIVGRPAAPLPPADGVRDLGFVDDLDAVLGSARAMVAPIRTGGGVRVKALDAASRGLPIVSTSVGLGSLDEVFRIPPHDDPESFIAEARRLLLDAGAAHAESRRLHELNAARWEQRVPHARVSEWLQS